MKHIRFKTIKNGIIALVMLSIFMLFSTYALAQDIMAEITPEGALTGSYADPSNNIVLTEGYYIINFNTAASGAIKKVEMEFPSGYDINPPHLLIALGIGGGSIARDSLNLQKLVYTVSANPPPSIPSGKNMKFFISNIKNNSTTTLQSITITTKDSLGNIIDGPTSTSDIQLTQVTTPMISDNSITTSKIVDGAVTSTKIAPTAVGPSQLSNGAVWSTHILDGTVAPVDLSFDPATQAELDVHKGSADHDTRYFTEAELSTPGTINTTSNPVDWTKLKNVPPGFADNTDNEGGGASGWTDDGSVVRLTTNTDNVGIGTTNPSEKLHVAGDLKIDSTSKGILLNALDRPMITRGWDIFTSGTYSGIGRWGMFMEPFQLTFGIANISTRYFKFRAFNADSTGVDLMTIRNDGNVGIGTTNPSAKLEIAGGGELLFSALTEDPGDIVFRNSDGVQKGRIWSNPSAGQDLFLSSGDNIPDIAINPFGNVGIGTTQPTFGRLAIEHSGVPLSLRETDVAVDQGGLWRMPLDGGVLRFDVNTGTPGNEFGNNFRTILAMNSDGSVDVPVIRILGGADIAEPFDIKDAEAIRPGMVVAIDPEQPGNLRIADKSYDRTVAGIISGANGINPGLIMKDEGTEAVGSHPVALTGRVYTWVDTSYGAIQPGDLLTTSDTAGHAMKVSDHAKAQGAIIGKAMTALKEGKGLVLVLVTLQ